MTTGVSCVLPLRLAAAAETVRRTAVASVTVAALAASGSRKASAVSPSTTPMLKKANKSYEARIPTGSGSSDYTAAAGPRPAPPSDLKKTLFPSSSPRDTSIADYYKRPLAATSQASKYKHMAAFNPPKPRPTASAKPLQSRSPNTTHATSSASISGFVTLCGKSDSFTEEPPIATPPQAAAVGLQQADENDLMAFGVSLEDFTDDENLGLDIQTPCALPSEPAAELAAANTSIASAFSWPSSSPSHLHPPDAQRSDGNRGSVKRSSPDGGVSASPLPVAKKRGLPKTWSKVPQEDARNISATPAPKPVAATIWDPSASAVKAQKKQLKDQSRRLMPVDGGGDGSRLDAKNSRDLISEVTSLPKPSGPLTLSNEQQHVKNLVCFKKASVFFTGPAGTGKSVLMRAIIDDLRTKYAKEPEQLGVTASTGLAACNIGGMTLHSFAGIGLGKEDAQTLIRKIRQNQKARNRWLKTKTLVIDEVSMVDGDLFDKLSQIGRTIRKNGRPWGGIQLVLTGDFFQLPPVPDREKRDVKFAFEASTWATSIDHTIGLTEVFRQKDPEFARMLNEMRLGRISDQTVHTFKSLARPLQFNDGLEVTELFPTRQEVENSNERRLKGLSGKSYHYEALDTGEPALRDKLLQNMMAPKMLDLRVGAQVMLIKNMDETLVNGSLGTVEKFMTENEYTMLDVDTAPIDPETKKRTKILNSYLNNNNNDGAAGSGGGGRLYPYVLFHGIGGATRGILIRPEEWKSELPNGFVQASRTQLPLILAWALSIHKAQGQTLERVKVDLGRVFEKGQAYVALSRATTKHGLQVLRFEKHKVMAHPKVVDFYGKLSSAESALKGKGGDSSILAFTNKTSVKLDQQAPLAQKTARAAYGTG